MIERDLLRRTSDAPDNSLDLDGLSNLRAFFAILMEWDEADRADARQIAAIRRERGARTVAAHFRESVESN